MQSMNCYLAYSHTKIGKKENEILKGDRQTNCNIIKTSHKSCCVTFLNFGLTDIPQTLPEDGNPDSLKTCCIIISNVTRFKPLSGYLSYSRVCPSKNEHKSHPDFYFQLA